jgi:6-phosphofructo-2-kinase/fructose-2,6-biphosphatase 2
MYRRTMIGVNCNSTFFDQSNQEALKARETCCIEAMNDLMFFLTSEQENGIIAILDGTNTRVKRRRMIEQFLAEKMTKRYTLIWVESVCTIDSIIEQNIMKTKLKSQDYGNWDPELAVQDFRNRIKEYEKVYEALS